MRNDGSSLRNDRFFVFICACVIRLTIYHIYKNTSVSRIQEFYVGTLVFRFYKYLGEDL